MSRIKLKSINSMRMSVDMSYQPGTYIGTLISSKSSFDRPIVITDSAKLQSLFSDIEYFPMYREIIDRGINLCLLSIHSESSKYNRCSLRLGQSEIYSYPKIDRFYTYENIDLESKGITWKDLIEKDFSFQYLLDFSNVDPNVLRPYLGTGDDNDPGLRFIIIPIKYSEDNDLPVNLYLSNHDYNKNLELDYNYYTIADRQYYPVRFATNHQNIDPTSPDPDQDDSSGSMTDMIQIMSKNFKYLAEHDDGGPDHQSRFNYTVTTLLSWLESKLRSYCILHPITNEVIVAVKGDSNRGIKPNYEWIESFNKLIYTEECPFEYPKIINEVISPILINYIQNWSGSNPPTIEDTVSHVIHDISVKDLCDSNYKILLTLDNPAVSPVINEVPGLKVTSNVNYNYDLLCKSLEKDKVVDFYAKVRGPAGKNIKINIEEDPDNDAYYISISDGVSFEDYHVNLKPNTLDNRSDDIISISVISNRSNLVDVIFYDYQYYITETEYELISSIDYPESPEYEIGFTPTHIRSDLKLIPGEYYLNRTVNETFDYQDLINSLEVYKTSGYYPELFLVDNLPSEDSYIDSLLDALSFGTEEDPNMNSQALINLKLKNFNGRSYPSKENRLLYFYGTVIKDDISYPSYYPYLYNILSQDYLNLPNQDFIYNPFELVIGNIIFGRINLLGDTNIQGFLISEIYRGQKIQDQSGTTEVYGLIRSDGFNYTSGYYILQDDKLKMVNNVPQDEDHPNILSNTWSIASTQYPLVNSMEYLNDSKINTIMYDGIRYYWQYLLEPEGQEYVFMIRACIAKVSREINKVRSNFKGNSDSRIRFLLDSVVNNCNSTLKLITGLNYDIYYNSNYESRIRVIFTFRILKLTNKTFSLDIILNV